LARGSSNAITAVGDDDQRIYAWRDKGASAPEVDRLMEKHSKNMDKRNISLKTWNF